MPCPGNLYIIYHKINILCHAHVIWYDICPGNKWSLSWWCWCWRASVMMMVVNNKELLLSFELKEKKLIYRQNSGESGEFSGRSSELRWLCAQIHCWTWDNIPLKNQLIASMMACWTLLLPCSLSIKCQTSSTAIYPLTPCYKAI